MRTLSRCVLALAIVSSPAVSAADDAWKQPAMSKQELVTRFVPGDLAATLGQLEPDVAATLRSDFASAERLVANPAERVAWATVTSSFLEGVGFNGVARAYANWAVLQGPDSPTAIANLAALTCTPSLLRLAVELDPKNPVPLTNLGSCALSAQQWELARTAWEQALTLDPKHRQALLGLAQYWLHVPDVGRAADYLVRANGYAIRRDAKGDPVPPEKPVEPKQNRMGGGPAAPAVEEGESGASHVVATELELPPPPSWPSPDAFIVSGKARKPLATFYGEKVRGSFKFAAGVLRKGPGALAPKAEGDPLEEALHPKWDDSEPSRMLALNYAWASAKLRKANEEYEVAEREFKKLGKALKEVARARNDKIEQLCPAGASGMAAAKRCIIESREQLADSCKQSLALNGKLFAAWRDSYLRWYEQVKPVLEELWSAQNLWIRQLSDQQVYEAALVTRDGFIFGPLSVRMVEEDMMRLLFVGQGAAAFGATAEVCPKELPPKLEEPPPVSPPNTSGPGQECPLPKGGLDIPPLDVPGLALPFSFNVTCKEATLTISAGLGKFKSRNELVSGGARAVLRVTHRFATDKSTVVYVGVEGSAKAKTLAGSSVGVKGGTGLSFEFSRQGQLTNVDSNAGVSTSLELPGGAGKASIGLTAAVEKGALDLGSRMSASGGNPFF
ncbi:MAG: hypothetical protein ACOZQL_18940 [Myxococcota bacterium]